MRYKLFSLGNKAQKLTLAVVTRSHEYCLVIYAMFMHYSIKSENYI